MTIKKAYYVIYRGNQIELHGSSLGITILPAKSAQVALFDTLQLMNQYIEDNNLILPQLEDIDYYED